MANGFMDAISGFGKQAGNLLEDPNFQRTLAQVGQGIDPQGAGGNIGRAAEGMIQRGQQAELLERLLASGGEVNIGADGSMKARGPKPEQLQSALAGQNRQPEDVMFGTGLDQSVPAVKNNRQPEDVILGTGLNQETDSDKSALADFNLDTLTDRINSIIGE